MEDTPKTEEAVAYVEVGLGPVKATIAAFDGDRILVAAISRRSAFEQGAGSAGWRQVASLAGSLAGRCSTLAAAAGREVREHGARLLPVAKELTAQAEAVQQ